jgi:hypothetical protein
MSKITQIQHDNETGRVIVYVNYRFCASIRQDIWDEMNLREGSKITFSELESKEAFYRKKSCTKSNNQLSRKRPCFDKLKSNKLKKC